MSAGKASDPPYLFQALYQVLLEVADELAPARIVGSSEEVIVKFNWHGIGTRYIIFQLDHLHCLPNVQEQVPTPETANYATGDHFQP